MKAFPRRICAAKLQFLLQIRALPPEASLEALNYQCFQGNARGRLPDTMVCEKFASQAVAQVASVLGCFFVYHTERPLERLAHRGGRSR